MITKTTEIEWHNSKNQTSHIMQPPDYKSNQCNKLQRINLLEAMNNMINLTLLVQVHAKAKITRLNLK